MTTPIDRESVERLTEMVAIACDILQDEAADVIRKYDGVECDGGCVADDLESAFETVRAALDTAEGEVRKWQANHDTCRATALSAEAKNKRLRGAIEQTTSESCEGWCLENGGKGKFEDCYGCIIHARAALQETPHD